MDLPAAVRKETRKVNVRQLSSQFNPADEDGDEVQTGIHDGMQKPSNVEGLVSMFQSTTEAEATNSPQQRNVDIQKQTQVDVPGSKANAGTERQNSKPERPPTLLVKPRVRPRNPSAPDIAYASEDERTIHKIQDDQEITKLQVPRKLSTPEAHSDAPKSQRPLVPPRPCKIAIQKSHPSEKFNPFKIPEHTSTTPDDTPNQQHVPRVISELEEVTNLKEFNPEYYAKKAIEAADLEYHGVRNITVFQETLDKFMESKINLAVTGQSGMGKSTLINTLRCMLPKDKSAAAVGTRETTMEVRSYPFPANNNLLLWDLPGVGTPKFPQKTYLEKVGLTKYDAMIICSSGRFTTIDLWLAHEAQCAHIPLYFIRTKIDADIENAAEDHGHKEDEALAHLRSDTEDKLRQNGVLGNRLFLISSKLKDQLKWDFPQLIKELIEDAPQKNSHMRKAIMMAMVTCSEHIIEMKRQELSSRIPRIAQAAASAQDGQHEDFILEEIRNYMTWFGLFDKVLDKYNIDIANLAKHLQDINEVLEKVQNHTIPEYTKGRDVGKWVFGIGYLFGMVHDKKMNKKLRQEKEEKLLDTADEVSTRRQQEILQLAVHTLTDALNNCVILTLGIFEHRRRLETE